MRLLCLLLPACAVCTAVRTAVDSYAVGRRVQHSSILAYCKAEQPARRARTVVVVSAPVRQSALDGS